MHVPHPVRVYSLPSTDAISQALDVYVTKVSAEAVARHGMFTVAVSGGSLPKLLCRLRQNETVDFAAWHVFFVDERCVPLNSEESNYLLLKNELLDHVPVPASQVYTINETLLRKPEEAAEDYMDKLKNLFAKKNAVKVPCFDLILLGIGPDGHTASLFPGHPLLNEDLEWVGHVTDSPKPPPSRITLTLPVLNHAHHIAFVVTGEGKRDAVRQILDEKNEELPPTNVKPHGELVWFLDEAAASDLTLTKPTPFML